MKTKGSFLVVLALTVVFAGVAAAQQEPPPGYQQPPPGYQQQPPPGYEQAPPPAYAPPPGYAPPPAGYPPPPPMQGDAMTVLFGAPGQLVISDDMFISAINTKQNPPDNIAGGTSSSSTFIQFRPAVDIFVASGLSIGGQVDISLFSDDATDGSTTTVGVVPRMGYNIPLGSKASIWPRIAAGYYFSSYGAGGGYPSTSGYTFTFSAFVPVLFHPVPHFFIGGGPRFSTDLVSKYEDADQATFSQFGVQTTIGGYFGGR
jgi:hypothetical protein